MRRVSPSLLKNSRGSRKEKNKKEKFYVFDDLDRAKKELDMCFRVVPKNYKVNKKS
jgi:hypothetical protein